MANLVRREAKRRGHGTETTPPAKRGQVVANIGNRLKPDDLNTTDIGSFCGFLSALFKGSSIVSCNTTTQDELDNACQAWLLV
jgi:hypothetical protein